MNDEEFHSKIDAAGQELRDLFEEALAKARKSGGDHRGEFLEACGEAKVVVDDCVASGDMTTVLRRIVPYIQRASMAARLLGFACGPVEMQCVIRRENGSLFEGPGRGSGLGTFQEGWEGPRLVHQYGYVPLGVDQSYMGRDAERHGLTYSGPTQPLYLHEATILFDASSDEGLRPAAWKSVSVTLSQWIRQVEKLPAGVVVSPCDDRIVTIAMVAEMVSMAAHSMSPYVAAWPAPDERGRGQLPNKWKLSNLLPTLRQQFGERLKPD